MSAPIGMWRSLVAHLTGGQGVAGSNPVIPTANAWWKQYFHQAFCRFGVFPTTAVRRWVGVQGQVLINLGHHARG